MSYHIMLCYIDVICTASSAGLMRVRMNHNIYTDDTDDGDGDSTVTQPRMMMMTMMMMMMMMMMKMIMKTKFMTTMNE